MEGHVLLRIWSTTYFLRFKQVHYWVLRQNALVSDLEHSMSSAKESGSWRFDCSLEIRVQLLQFCNDIRNCGASQASQVVVADLVERLSWHPRHRIRAVPGQGQLESTGSFPKGRKGVGVQIKRFPAYF
jgi:hypothetical protein